MKAIWLRRFRARGNYLEFFWNYFEIGSEVFALNLALERFLCLGARGGRSW